MAAQSEAIDRRHEYLCVEHILYALLHNDQGVNVIRSCGGDTNIIKQDLRTAFLSRKKLMKTSFHARHVLCNEYYILQ